MRNIFRNWGILGETFWETGRNFEKSEKIFGELGETRGKLSQFLFLPA